MRPQVHARAPHPQPHTYGRTRITEHLPFTCCVCFEDVSSITLISRQFNAQGSFVSSNWSCWSGVALETSLESVGWRSAKGSDKISSNDRL